MRFAIALLLLFGCAEENESPRGGDPTPGDEARVGDELNGDAAPNGGDVFDAGGDALPQMWPSGKYISPTEVYAHLLAGNAEMLPLNVVDEEYYYLGHIEGSVVIPWDELAGRLAEVDSARHVVVYCRRGVRSESGYDTLVGNGYESVWVMAGGIEDWIDLGYPVVH